MGRAERTQWLPRAAAAIAFIVVLNLAAPTLAAADSGRTGAPELERRSYAALADRERVLLRLWTAREMAITDAVAAHRTQASLDAPEIKALEIAAPEIAAPGRVRTMTVPRLIAETNDEVDWRALILAMDRAELDAIVAALERATALRRSALQLADRRDPRSRARVPEADAAERDALGLAASFGLIVPPVFTLARPAAGEVSSPFGTRGREFHEGIDLAAPLGSRVVASAAGVVVAAGRPYAPKDDAVVVIVDHGAGLRTLYGHLAPRLVVRVGQRVEAGTLLGRVGLTGRVTGAHLHFALYFEDRPIDPARFLSPAQ